MFQYHSCPTHMNNVAKYIYCKQVSLKQYGTQRSSQEHVGFSYSTTPDNIKMTACSRTPARHKEAGECCSQFSLGLP